MNAPTKGEYRSAVYTQRPPYADYDAPRKFLAIRAIVAKRLIEHPKAICSYSGGSDSDIMIDLVESVRAEYNLPPIKYVFFNTGLEMKATKEHVKATAEKYGVEIETVRPKTNIVLAARRYGIPFVSKIMSGGLEEWQKKGVPLSIADEYAEALIELVVILHVVEQRLDLLLAHAVAVAPVPQILGFKCRILVYLRHELIKHLVAVVAAVHRHDSARRDAQLILLLIGVRLVGKSSGDAALNGVLIDLRTHALRVYSCK